MNKIINNFYNSIIYDNRYMYILKGLFNTLIIAMFATLLGIIIGVIISFIRNNYKENKKYVILNYISNIYVSIIRGTPVLLQLMIIYYIIFQKIDINLIIIGILAFGINSGAYVSEIIRAGIDSIDKGQMEACKSLGLSYYKSMRYVIIPQAIKNILPALGNEFITLIKETSIAGYIGIIELTKAGDIIASRTYNYFFPLLITALIYLLITSILNKSLEVVERRMNNAKS